MASRVRDHDWSSTSLGPIDLWPQALRTAVGICLHSSHPTAIYWGPELRLIYNDAWAPIPGGRHPDALGRPGTEVWSDIWHIIGPQFAGVMDSGEGFTTFDQMLPMLRDGAPQETYWNYSFTPILDDSGAVGGIFNQGNETTDTIMTARTQAFLLDVGDRIRAAIAPERDPTDVLTAALEAVGPHLGVARVGYAEVDPDRAHCTVIEDWARDAGVPRFTGERHRFSEYGEAAFAPALAGEILATADVGADPRLPPTAAATFLAVGIVANLIVPIARDGRTFAFLFVNDDKPHAWARREIEGLREAADRIWLGYEQARSTTRLRESEGRFAAIFGQAAVGLAEMALDGRFLRVNGAMTRLLGRSPDGLRQSTVFDVTHPDDLEETARRLEQATVDGEPFQIEKRYLKPDGSYVWTIANITRLVDERGRPSGFLSVTADITERREAERVRVLLLAELNHRVKNNLATVQALARQTRRSSSGPADFETAFDARLMALSRAHDLLMGETWSSASLAEIGGAVLAPYDLDERQRIVISGPLVRLSPTAAVTMTMALHELATNAAKFGALSLGEGHVVIEWAIDPESRSLDFAWRETGGPSVSPPARRGYGTRLIERGVVQELGGEARLDFSEDGVVCRIRVPLSQKVMA